MSYEWRVEDSPYSQSVNFFGFKHIGGKPFHIEADLRQVEHEPGMMVEPGLRFSPEEAQQILNELWRIGLRPKDGNGAVAHTEAIQGHLSDMRKIVASKLKVEL